MSGITKFPYTFTWNRHPDPMKDSVWDYSPAFEAGGVKWRLYVNRGLKNEIGFYFQLYSDLPEGIKVQCRHELVVQGLRKGVVDNTFSTTQNWGYRKCSPPINLSVNNTLQVIIHLVTVGDGLVHNLNSTIKKLKAASSKQNDGVIAMDQSLERFLELRRKLIHLREDHDKFEELEKLLDGQKDLGDDLTESMWNILADRKAKMSNLKESLSNIEFADEITPDLLEKRNQNYDALSRFAKRNSALKLPLERLSLYIPVFDNWQKGSEFKPVDVEDYSKSKIYRYMDWKSLNAEHVVQLRKKSDQCIEMMTSTGEFDPKSSAMNLIAQQNHEIEVLLKFDPSRLKKRLETWINKFKRRESLFLEIEAIEKQILKRVQFWRDSKNESTSLDQLEQLENSIAETELALLAFNVQKRRRLNTYEGAGKEELKSQLMKLNSKFQLEYHRLYRLACFCFPELKRKLKVFDHECVMTSRRLFDYKDLEPLTIGENNLVTLRKANFNDHDCVLKIFNLETATESERFNNELKQLSKLAHPNIIKMEAAFRDDIFGYIHMPFYKNGRLTYYLQQNPELSVSDKRTIALDILGGLCYIHKSGLFHCDLQPDNIFIEDNARAVIGDFELSMEELFITTSTDNAPIMDLSNLISPMSYMSPDKVVSTKSDVYSFGLILFDMHFPPSGENYQRPPLQNVVDEKIDIGIPDIELFGLKPLLQLLLQFDSTKRLEANEAILADYFTKWYDGGDPSSRKLQCMVCFDECWSNQGVACGDITKDKECHFICKDCFNGYLQNCSTQPLSYWKQRNYEVTCMQSQCNKKLESSAFVSILSPEAFEAYQSIMIKINESKVTQELEQVFEKRMEQAAKENMIDLHLKTIQEEILNLRCPACKMVFIDFTGCFALKCGKCGCGFCAWCLQSCGTDAHAHVAKCTKAVTNNRTYGTMEQFQLCHERRKADMIQKYFSQVIVNPQTIEKVRSALNSLEKKP